MNTINSSILGIVTAFTIANCTPLVPVNYYDMNNSFKEGGIMLELKTNYTNGIINSIPLSYNEVLMDDINFRKSRLEQEAIYIFGEMRMLTNEEILQRDSMYEKMSTSTGVNFFDLI